MRAMEVTAASGGEKAHRTRKPLFGGHSGAEAGASRYAPTAVLLATRALFTLWMVANVVYLGVDGRFHLKFLTNWSYLCLILAFVLLALCSLLLLLRRESALRALAQVAVPLHCLASTAAVFIVPAFFAFLGEPPFDYGNLVGHGLNLIPITADLALGAQYRFRLAYILPVLAYFVLYVVFMWIRFAVWRDHPGYEWPYPVFNFENQSAGLTVAYYVGFFAWAAVAALIVIGVNRLVTFGECKSQAQEKTDNEAKAVDQEAGQSNSAEEYRVQNWHLFGLPEGCGIFRTERFGL